MKKLKWFALAIGLAALSSCDEGGRNTAFTNYAKIRGEWTLESMTYTDEMGDKTLLNKPNTSLTFLGDLNRNTLGEMKTSVGYFQFTYNLSHETFSLNISDSEANLPFDAPGRTNTLKISFLNKKKFEITAPNEYFKPEKRIIYDVVYTFKRI